MVTTKGIAGKRKTGCPKGVTPMPFSYEVYTIMDTCASIPPELRNIRKQIIEGSFETDDHVILCASALRDSLISSYSFAY